MEKLHGTTWIIRDKKEFRDDSGIYPIVDEFVKNQEKEDGVRWFFDLCYADWENKTYSVMFNSYNTQEYEDYYLSLKVTGDKKEGFEIDIIKKTTK